ncbi:MAG: HAD-IG family 5'-nucleotidase, partial [Polyangiaceae bacterium]|nr:HAD-IG family 5'-nucleotidase [Polyangiaceae bacterium]
MVLPEQLALPLPDIEVSPRRVGIPRAKRIFVNRNLMMSGIDWIGFDMDYTLAAYDRQAMDALFIGVAVDRLRERGYPATVSEIEADPAFPIRGLVIDTKLGHVIKLDGYRVPRKGYHGMDLMAREALREAYSSRRIRLGTPRYQTVDTLYGLAEASLYAALVDGLRKRGMQVEYARLFADVRESADAAYRDGTITGSITANFGRYLRRDPKLAQTLHKMRSAGKRLFLLTNSPWPYTDATMYYLLGDAMPEYPTWRHYFDVVIAAACKPAFFRERRPLLERETDSIRRNYTIVRPV